MSNFILQNQNAVFYECGYSCDNELFLSLNGRNFLFTDSRYAIEAREFVKECEVVEIKHSLFKEARQILRKFEVKNLIYDPNDFSVLQFDEFSKLSRINFISRPNFSKKKRVIKSASEIKTLKEAAKFGALKFDEFAKFIDEYGEGMSEKELFFEASRILKDSGNLELSFDPIVAINENGSKAHAIPSQKSLKNGDLLLFDAGVKFNHYCSDRTRTICFDKDIAFSKNQSFKNSKIDEVYGIVKEAQDLAIKAVKPGIRACDVDFVAREFITKNGYAKEFFHSTGHGVGLDIHELPNINTRDTTVLMPGMVFSIEPGIYLQNEFGVRIEDVVVVTDSGCEIL
ncbi:MAG: aminopeptidase P family protein [Campylobacter sp.]|nr:aminopeptidase P family protein [Campylobacter sp.]